jgi:hypothetical protein
LPAIILAKLRYQENSLWTRVIILFAITIVTAPIITFGQKKIILRCKAAVTGDIYKIEDNAHEIKKTPLTSGLWGDLISKQELTNICFRNRHY